MDSVEASQTSEKVDKMASPRNAPWQQQTIPGNKTPGELAFCWMLLQEHCVLKVCKSDQEVEKKTWRFEKSFVSVAKVDEPAQKWMEGWMVDCGIWKQIETTGSNRFNLALEMVFLHQKARPGASQICSSRSNHPSFCLLSSYRADSLWLNSSALKIWCFFASIDWNGKFCVGKREITVVSQSQKLTRDHKICIGVLRDATVVKSFSAKRTDRPWATTMTGRASWLEGIHRFGKSLAAELRLIDTNWYKTKLSDKRMRIVLTAKPSEAKRTTRRFLVACSTSQRLCITFWPCPVMAYETSKSMFKIWTGITRVTMHFKQCANPKFVHTWISVCDQVIKDWPKK